MKKLLLPVIFFLFVITIFAPRIAQADNWWNDPTQNTPVPWYDQTPATHEQTLDNSSQGVTQESWVQSTFNGVANAGNHALLMSQIQLPNGQSTRGAVGMFAYGIDVLTRTKPASSIDYIAYEINNLRVPGSPQPAYAITGGTGGVGFNSLTPVLSLWTMTRNLAYIIFAIIFVVIGIMIMTRQKIDPKTVASIQNALPKIIFALILVTFSYAIAGLLVDLMFVSIAITVTLISSANPVFGIQTTDVLSHNLFWFVFQGGFWSAVTSASAAINTLVKSFIEGPATQSTGATQLIGFLGSAVAFLIIAVALLVALFRTWLALLGAYANIILGIIMAPLQLMLDAIPGQNQFGNWLKNMLANLLAFPLVLIMITFGAIISSNYFTPNSSSTGFIPPLIGGGNQAAIQALVGLGIILTIPKALNILQEVFKAPAFKYGNAWMEPVNWTQKQLQGPTKSAYRSFYSSYTGVDEMRGQAYKEGMAKFQAGLGPEPKKTAGLNYGLPFYKRILPKPPSR